MRAWVVTVGEPLPIDGGGDRLHRSGMLAGALAARGHDVLWWSSTFDHSRKVHRPADRVESRPSERLTLKLLHGRGYRRNVSFARLANHREIGAEFRRLGTLELRPDVIVASWPTIELCEAAVAFGRAWGVPVILDVRDLWPDIFAELAPRPARFLARAALAPMYRSARRACAGATGIVGVTPAFVSWGLAHAGRPAADWDRPFPLGYSEQSPTSEAIAKAEAFWDRAGVTGNDGRFIACFFGTMGLQKLDMAPVIDAARALSGRGFQFVLCGDGDGLKKFRAMANGLPDVIFPGWVGGAEIWTLMRRSSAGLAPYTNSLNYTDNIPNKPIEYLSAGLPILSGLRGVLANLLDEHACGITYRDAGGLASALVSLRDDPARLAAMRSSAAALYRERFVAESVYDGMASYLEEVAASGAASRERRAVASC